MPLDIKPQDRTRPEKLEVELHPNLIARLREYADRLNGSDISYVVSEILDQALPADKGPKKAKPESASKAKQPSAKKTKEGPVAA